MSSHGTNPDQGLEHVGKSSERRKDEPMDDMQYAFRNDGPTANERDVPKIRFVPGDEYVQDDRHNWDAGSSGETWPERGGISYSSSTRLWPKDHGPSHSRERTRHRQTDKQTNKRKRRVMFVIAIVVAIVLSIPFIAIYAFDKDAETTDADTTGTITLAMTLDNTFEEGMADPTSNVYNSTEAELCRQVSNAFDSHDGFLKSTIRVCELASLTNANGSIIVKLTIIIVGRYQIPKNNIYAIAITDNVGTSGTFGRFNVVPGSIVVTATRYSKSGQTTVVAADTPGPTSTTSQTTTTTTHPTTTTTQPTTTTTTTQPTTPYIPPGCDSKTDLIFLLDDARSVGPTNFQTMKYFIKNFTASVNVSIDNNALQIGVVRFGVIITYIFGLNEYDNQKNISSAVDDMNYTGGSTGIVHALRYVRKHAFTTRYGARLNAARVIVIMTDGRHKHHSGHTPEGTSATLKSEGFLVVSIGIGSHVNDTLLRTIAYNSTFAFHEPDGSAMISIKDIVQPSLCDFTNDRKKR